MAIGSRLCPLVAGVTLVAGSAFAQAPNPAPIPTAQVGSVPGENAPSAESTAPAQNLSEKLNQSNGVIHPKEVDPAIEKPAPRWEIRTWCRRQGLQAALPRRSQNERPLLAIGSRVELTEVASQPAVQAKSHPDPKSVIP